MLNQRKEANASGQVWYDRSASLVDSETIVQALTRTTESQRGIHRSTEDQRFALIAAFVFSEDVDLRKRAEKIGDCCKWPILFVKGDGSPALSLQRCRDRLCPVCSRIKGMQSAARITDAVQAMKSVRFYTLTEMSTGKTLNEAIDQLMAGFRELRRSPVWKRYVVAGIWTVEVKPGLTVGTWNVHLHILADGSFFPQRELSEAWLRATGDSFVVDVRKVHSVNKAAQYVTKYVAKPGDFTQFSTEQLVTFAKALKGRRLLGTFGKLHAVKLDKEETTEVNPSEIRSISANKLTELESDGFEPAKRACDLLEIAGGYWAACVGRSKPLNSPKLLDTERIELGKLLSVCSLQVDSLAVAKPPAAQMQQEAVSQIEMWKQPMLVDEWLYAPQR